MRDFLEKLPNWLVFAFVVDNMFALGLELTPGQILAPLRDIPATLKALIANFVLVPLLAYLLVRGLEFKHGLALGLVLLASSAGDPFVTKLSQSAHGDAAYSLAVMALMSAATVVFMPLMLPVQLPGVRVDPVEIIKPLGALILLPLAMGLLVRVKFPAVARKIAGPLDRLASVLVYCAVALFALVHYSDIVGTLGSYAILASALLVAGGLLAGAALGGPSQIRRNDLALNTAWRGVSAALAVGIRNFPAEHQVFTMAIIQVLVSAAILMPISATVMRKMNVAARGG